MSLRARKLYDAFAIGLPYLVIGWEYGRLYHIELNWPIGLWSIQLQIKFA